MNYALRRIGFFRLLPVITIDRVNDAEPLGNALLEGDLPIAEVTFRTEAAEGAIRALSKLGGLIVGAGTCLTAEQVDRACDAGAQFIVTPGTNPKVVEHALKRGISITPGVATPTDIEMAVSLGVSTLKFFPAEALGGIEMIQALEAPYPGVKFIPTGGIALERLPGYLGLESVLACGASWLAPREVLASTDFDQIVKRIRRAKSFVNNWKCESEYQDPTSTF
jgi:2-dehydro-3-deoxyphosphogluconate aldolase / (4S)-4-hydroxy-2-oxoglutarate aldolase